ncbi:hypothetical protein QJS66_00950 [Kocuria rhizophila]|nr:hypothetical protein QJS66_00950 [Kocuria rhizophila]
MVRVATPHPGLRRRRRGAPADRHPDGHGWSAAVSRRHEFSRLCVGGWDGMFTDATGLLNHGGELVVKASLDAERDGWTGGRGPCVTGQVSDFHANSSLRTWDRPPRSPRVSVLGDAPPAALPMTLALESKRSTRSAGAVPRPWWGPG